MLEISLYDTNLRLLLSLLMLITASILDVWRREINDILWIIFGAAAVILIVFSPNPVDLLKNTGISLIIAPLVIVLWRMGIFGGADALGLITLAALAPQLSLTTHIITPFTTLTNAAILSATPLFINLSRNLIAISKHEKIFEGFEETRSKKIIAIFFGHKAKHPKYSFSIERSNGESKKLDFSLRHAENDSFCNTPNTWVTPGIPYMVYITAGFVVQLLFGDIIFSLIGTVK